VSHYANASNFLGTFVVLGANQQLVYIHTCTYTPQLAAVEKANLHFNQTQSASKYFAHVARLDFTISLRARKISRSCKVLGEKVDNRDLGAVSSTDPRASPAASAVRPTGGCGENFLMQRNICACALAHQTLVLGEMKFSL
jgi:hypothetical protein